MRIIGGSLKGRSFHPPKTLPVRPTTDFSKEALFNILNNKIDFEAIKALDLFAGTGSISYELASRGCTDILAVDQNYGCTTFIKTTAASFSLSGIRSFKSDVFKFLRQTQETFDFIFADPPYDLSETSQLPGLILTTSRLNPGGIFILEHPNNLNFNQEPFFLEQRSYSKVNFTIFSIPQPESNGK